MIDKIIRRSYSEYVIVFTNRPAMVVSSSGNAYALLEYLLWAKNVYE